MDRFEITHRLVTLCPNVSAQDYADGIKWYQDANTIALSLSLSYDVPLVQVCGLIAAYSINTHWSTNLAWTEQYLQGQPIGMRVHIDKADHIMATTNERDIADILNGQKCRAFFHNILYVRDSQEVTIDRWIARALGVSQKSLKQKMGHADTVYERIADSVRDIASLKGIRPLELQAAIWVAVRGSAD